MGTQCSCTAKVYFPSILGQFTDDHQQQHPREYGGAVGWWSVVEVMGLPKSGTDDASALGVTIAIATDGLSSASGDGNRMEPIGLEPTTSCMPCRRSPN